MYITGLYYCVSVSISEYFLTVWNSCPVKTPSWQVILVLLRLGGPTIPTVQPTLPGMGWPGVNLPPLTGASTMTTSATGKNSVLLFNYTHCPSY